MLPTWPSVARAVDGHQAHLAGGHAHLRVVAFLGHQLRRGAGAAHHLARRGRAAARCCGCVLPSGMLRSGRQLPTRISASAPRHQAVADLQAVRRQDVALLAVGVDEQGDARRAVRVVLDGGDARRHAVLVALEVDDAVAALVAAAAVAVGDAALVVAAGLSLERLSSELAPACLRVISSKVETDMPRRPGDVGLYFLTGIGTAPHTLSEEIFDGLPGREGHDGLLPAEASCRAACPMPFSLGRMVIVLTAEHRDVEALLDASLI